MPKYSGPRCGLLNHLYIGHQASGPLLTLRPQPLPIQVEAMKAHGGRIEPDTSFLVGTVQRAQQHDRFVGRSMFVTTKVINSFTSSERPHRSSSDGNLGILLPDPRFLCRFQSLILREWCFFVRKRTPPRCLSCSAL